MALIKNIDESISDVTKFLKKLTFAIQNESKFTFLNYKIVDKNRVDDIICCLEASMPSEYKKLIKLPSHKTYKSVDMYASLKKLLFRKFMFSSSSYFIDYGLAQSHIHSLIKIMEADIRRIYADL